MWEKRRGFTLDAGVILPSEPVSQCICMNLPKTDDNDRTHKNDANNPMPCLDIWSMFLSGQMPYRSNSSQLFWNFEDPVLV